MFGRVFEVPGSLVAADAALALLDDREPLEVLDPFDELPEDCSPVPVPVPVPPVVSGSDWDAELLARLVDGDPERVRSVDEIDAAVEDAPVTAWTAAELDGIDLAAASAPERVAAAALWQRVESYAAAMKARAVASYALAEPAHKGWDDLDPVPNEVSVALRIPLGAAQGEVYRARRLATHLPGTFALFRAGGITARHVRAVLDATGQLTAEQCAVVEAKILPGADRLGVAELSRKARRQAARLDTDGLRERHARKAAEADVTVDTDEDGMAWLNGRMSATDALVVKAAADAYAGRCKSAGDERTLGVLRAEGLRVLAQHWLGDAKPTHHGLPVEVHLAATPAALAGLTDTPGELVETGTPVPIEAIREMATQVNLRWLVICPDTGRVLYRDTVVYRPSPRQAAKTVATYPSSAGPHSTVPARRCDLDHTVSFDVGGPTHPDNLAPFDRGWHRAKTHGTFTVSRRNDGSLRWTTPLGQCVIVSPYDYRLGP